MVVVACLAAGCNGGETASVSEALESDLISDEIDRQVTVFSAAFDVHRTRLAGACSDEQCRSAAEAEALSEAVAVNADFIGEEGSVLEAVVIAGQADALRHRLADRYELATEPVDRLGILQVWLRTRQLDPRRLDDSLMQRFFDSDASSAERATLLEMHRVVGVSAAIGTQLSDWCVSASRAEALHCLAALGHEDTAVQLGQLVTHLRAEPSRSLAMRVGDAVGRCGAACTPIVQDLAGSGERWDRQAAYFAAARSPAQEARDTLASTLAAHGVAAEEEQYVERALGLDWRTIVNEERGR